MFTVVFIYCYILFSMQNFTYSNFTDSCDIVIDTVWTWLLIQLTEMWLVKNE